MFSSRSSDVFDFLSHHPEGAEEQYTQNSLYEYKEKLKFETACSDYENTSTKARMLRANLRTNDTYNIYCKDYIGMENQNLKRDSREETLNNSNIRNGRWTIEEDEMLKQLVKQFREKNWNKIASRIKSRSAIQCLHRWNKILKPGLIKGAWSTEEDIKLQEWVNLEGPKNWACCSQFIKGRNGKQCKDRWYNTMNPEVKKGNWSVEEDYNIFSLYIKYGSTWSTIAQYFPGRTENSVKNRFYSSLRKLHFKKTNPKKPVENSIQISSTSALLKLIPELLAEKKVRLAQIKGCNVDQLKTYDIINECGVKSTKKNNDNNKANEVKQETRPIFFVIKKEPNLSLNKPKETSNLRGLNELKNTSKDKYHSMTLQELEDSIISTCNLSTFTDPLNQKLIDEHIDLFLESFKPLKNDSSSLSISTIATQTNFDCFGCSNNLQNQPDKLCKVLVKEKGDRYLKKDTTSLPNQESNTHLSSRPDQEILNPSLFYNYYNQTNKYSQPYPLQLSPNSPNNLQNNAATHYCDFDSSFAFPVNEYNQRDQRDNNIFNSDADESHQGENSTKSFKTILNILNNLEQMFQTTKAEIMKFDR